MDTTIDLLPATLSTPTRSTRARWAGRILTGLPVAFLVLDVVVKLVDPPVVAETMAAMGLSPALGRPLGIVLAAALALYLWRRTAPLGAVVLTGYLGGAVLAHLRVGDPWLSHTLVPIYVGALLWAGLYLRDERVRRLVQPPAARSADARK